MGTGGSFSESKAAGGVKLITHLHLVLILRMYGAIPPVFYLLIKRKLYFLPLPEYIVVAILKYAHLNPFH
jgi:hypothetical protein